VTTVAWVVEGTWTGCVINAARAWAPAEDDVLLLHVTAAEVTEAAAGALAGLMGRGRARHSPWVEPAADRGGAAPRPTGGGSTLHLDYA
jgi:hypothetical protein